MIQKEYKYTVCTSCPTYNHVSFIVDAMNGFSMQETTFPVYYLISDDASTDGEPEVIKHYLAEHFHFPYRTEETDDYNLICAIHKTNPNCIFIVFLLKYNHYSIKKSKLPYQTEWRENAKYHAICEGDDYWIHKGFLQKAVSFLNENPDYSAVYGNKLVCDGDGKLISKTQFKKELTRESILRGNNMGIRNLIFRKEIRNVAPFVNKSRDIYIYYQCAVYGKLKYYDEDFAVYRLTGKGIHTFLDEHERMYNRYYHYFEIHKELDFKYQKDYVIYQISILLGQIKHISLFKYCLQLTRRFHVPSSKRFFWYPLVIIKFVFNHFMCKYKAV